MTTSAKPQTRQAQEPEWAVWALVVIMLIVGFGFMSSATGGVQSFSQDGISLNYPSGWVKMETENANQLLNAAEQFGAGYPTGIRLARMPLSEVGRSLEDPENLALAWTTLQSRELLAYSAIEVDTESATIGGNPAVAIEYAFVSPSNDGGVPSVAHAKDYLVVQGDTLTVITLTADAANFEQGAAVWEKILASFKFQ